MSIPASGGIIVDMGQRDAVEKTLESYNDVFADIVNGLLFHGQDVVREQDLTDAQSFSIYKADGKHLSQDRDVAKYWQKGQIRLSFIGMENQTQPDSRMPVRVINYDAAAYRAQLRDDVPDELYPVVTLVLYFGTEKRRALQTGGTQSTPCWRTCRLRGKRTSLPAFSATRATWSSSWRPAGAEREL